MRYNSVYIYIYIVEKFVHVTNNIIMVVRQLAVDLLSVLRTDLSDYLNLIK